MASHFLDDGVEGEPGFRPKPWYNRHGDCIVFKAENVGVIAERVDDILTLYLSAEDNRPVGFQIKGIKHLMARLRCNAVHVTGQSRDGDVRVSLAFALMEAYDAGAPTISRRAGYAEAQTLTPPRDEAYISLDELAAV